MGRFPVGRFNEKVPNRQVPNGQVTMGMFPMGTLSSCVTAYLATTFWFGSQSLAASNEGRNISEAKLYI